jgi:hypothetical protein
MRHVLSVVLGIVLAPLIYIAAGIAAVKFTESRTGDSLNLAPTAIALGAALAAGGLYALLVMARLSPVGPVLAGVLYLGVTIWALVSPSSFTDVVPGDLFSIEGALHIPVGMGTVILAVPLLVTIFSPRRWRRFATPGAMVSSYSAAPTYGAAPGSAAPTYDTPSMFDQPTVPTYQPPTYNPPVYTPPTYPGDTIEDTRHQ